MIKLLLAGRDDARMIPRMSAPPKQACKRDALLVAECEPSPEAVEAGARALRAWDRGSDWFDEGARKIWLEMALVEKRKKVFIQGL